MISAPPTVTEAQRLTALLGDRRPPAAVVVVGDVPQARWRFVARPDGSLDTGVLGIELEAAALPADDYRPLLGLVSATSGDVVGPAAVMASLRRPPDDPEPDGPDAAAAMLPPEMLRLDRRFPVEVRLLGRYPGCRARGSGPRSGRAVDRDRRLRRPAPVGGAPQRPAGGDLRRGAPARTSSRPRSATSSPGWAGPRTARNDSACSTAAGCSHPRSGSTGRSCGR